MTGLRQIEQTDFPSVIGSEKKNQDTLYGSTEKLHRKEAVTDAENRISLQRKSYPNDFPNLSIRRFETMNTMKKFENQRNPQIPTVTIRKNGTLCINSKAIQQFKLDEMRTATLYHDPKESVMGIRPTRDDKDPSAFRISKEKGRVSTISCRAFLKHVGIPYNERSKIYPADWDDKTGMILVRLG